MNVDPRPAGQSARSLRKLLSHRRVLWALRAGLVASGTALLVAGSALLLDGGSIAGQEAQAPADADSVERAVDESAALSQLDPGELILLETRSRWSSPAEAVPLPSTDAVVAPQPAVEAPQAGAPTDSGPAGPAAPAPEEVAPPPPPPPPPPPTPTATPVAAVAPVALMAKEAEFLAGLNAERVRAGLPPLTLDPALVNAARYRSSDMAANSYFSHTGLDGRTVFDLLDSWAVPYGWAGENLARNNYPDDEAVSVALRNLMGSPAHRDNILSPNYSRIGVGYARDGSGMHYLTTVFAG